MRLNVNKIVEVAGKYWEEMDKSAKESLTTCDLQIYILQRFVDGFIGGYIEQRKECLSEQEIVDLDKYRNEAKQIIANMDL